MGQAKLYGQKTSGIDINGIIKNYYVYAGENISAGDLVEYINGISSTTTETSVDTQLSSTDYAGDVISAVQLDNSRIFIAHSYSADYYLYGIVVTINGTTITAGTDTQLSTTYTARSISTQLLSNGNIFIAHDSGYSNYYLYGMIVSINGNTISAGADNKLNANTSTTGATISTQLLQNGNVFIAHSFTSYRLYGMIASINGNSISPGTDTRLSGTNNSGSTISTQLLQNGNVFIAHSYDSNYYLYGIVCFINGTTITTGNDMEIEKTTPYSGSKDISTVVLPNNNIFIAHRSTGQAYLYGIVCTINGSLVFVNGTDTIINDSETYTGFKISAVALDDTRVFIIHSYSSSRYLYAVIVTINGTTVTVGTDTQLNAETYSGNKISSLLLQNGTIFTAHSYSSNYNLYAQIFGIDEANNIPTNNVVVPTYETQVRKTTTPQFDGVAKTSGVGGTSTAHNQQVSIYTL